MGTSRAQQLIPGPKALAAVRILRSEPALPPPPSLSALGTADLLCSSRYGRGGLAMEGRLSLEAGVDPSVGRPKMTVFTRER